MKIPLVNTQGEVVGHALVDEEDYEWVSSQVWRLTKRGYAHTGRPPRYLHREVLGLKRGDGVEADHINRDRLDCRRSNLRVATSAQNRQNVPSRKGTSRFRGVRRAHSRTGWQAFCHVDGRFVGLGTYQDEEEAARVAEVYRLEHMPFAMPLLNPSPPA